MAVVVGTLDGDWIAPFGNSAGVTGGLPTDDADLLQGLGGNDRLDGGSGANTLEGGDGDDQIWGRVAGERLDGGSGNDVAILEDVAGGGVIDLGGGFAILPGGGIISLVSIENVQGSRSFADSILGTTGSGYVFGRGGDDTIRGGGGSDYLIGGSGADLLDGGGDSDSASYVLDGFDPAGDATRRVIVNLGTSAFVVDGETIAGGTAIDHWGSVDTLIGIERVDGSSADDLFRGSTANDVLQGQDGDDQILGDAGNDTLDGGGDDDRLDGGVGNDSLFGGSSDDTLLGEAGNDTLFGDAGNDLISGGDGIDTLRFGPQVQGELGRAQTPTRGVVASLATGLVTEDGFGGRDTIEGGRAGAFEVMVGTFHDDDLTGVWGPNPEQAAGIVFQLRGGEGNDTLRGDPAEGRFLAAAYGGDAAGGVVVDLVAGRAIDNWGDLDTLVGIGSVVGSNGDDLLVGNDLANWFSPGGGSDHVLGGRGIDFMSYFAASAAVILDLQARTAISEGFTDTIDGFEEASGGSGADTLRGSSGANILLGNDAADLLQGRGGADSLNGGAGNDAVQGGGGEDTLIGGEGDDSVRGGDGVDLIVGGLGRDTLDGDAGADRFQFEVLSVDGRDDIVDFVSGVDQIVLLASGFVGLPQGPLDAERFVAAPGGAPAAGTTSSRLYYDTNTGRLVWDDNGSVDGGRTVIASLWGAPDLVAADILIG